MIDEIKNAMAILDGSLRRAIAELLTERDTRTQERDACYEELTRVKAERDAALKALQKIRCIYCGFECSSDDANKLADHILNCDKSPLVQLNKDIQSRATDLIDMTRDEFIRICALTDNSEIHGICTRSQEMIEQKYPVIKQRDDAIKDRDAALKACAAYRDALAKIRDVPTVSSRCCAAAADVLESTDCGKGYHHERDCEPLVRICTSIRNRINGCGWGICGMYRISQAQLYDTDLIVFNEALAHWEKVKEGE